MGDKGDILLYCVLLVLFVYIVCIRGLLIACVSCTVIINYDQLSSVLFCNYNTDHEANYNHLACVHICLGRCSYSCLSV